MALLALLLWAAAQPVRGAEAGEAWLAAAHRHAAAQQYAQALAAYQQAARLAPGSALAWYGMGWSHYHLQQYRQAVAPLRQALRLAPGHREAAATLGEAYLELREYGSAEKTFRDLYRSGEDYPAVFGLARVLAYQQRYAEALPHAEKAVALRPDLPRPRVVLARIYRSLNRLAEAEEALSAAYALDPAFEPTLREQLSLYLATKRPALAQTPLYALLVRYPRDPGLLQAQVIFCQQAGLQDRLPVALEQLIAVLPAEAAAPYRRDLGALLLAEQKYGEAEAQLRLALESQPRDSASALLLAQALLGQGRPQAAADLLSALSRREPPQARVLITLAQAQMAAGQAGAALSTAERALALEAGSEVALTVAETAARKLGRLATARGYLRRLLAAHPGEATLRLRLAQTLEETGDLPEALVQYHMLATGSGGTATTARVRLATLALMSGNKEWELTLARKTPRRAELAGVLLQHNRLREAERVLGESLRQEADNPELVTVQTELLRRTGREAEAGSLLREAIRRYPQHTGLNRELGRWLCAQGEVEEGVSMLRQALRSDPLSLASYEALAECAPASRDFQALTGFLWKLAEPTATGPAQAEGMALDCLARAWERRAGPAEAARELRRLSDTRSEWAELAWRAGQESERAREYGLAAQYYQRAAQDPGYRARALRLAVMAQAQAGDTAAVLRTAGDYLSRVAKDPGALALVTEMGAAPGSPPELQPAGEREEKGNTSGASVSPSVALLVGLVGAEPGSFDYHRYRLGLFAERERLAEVLVEYAVRARETGAPADQLALALAQELEGELSTALEIVERQPQAVQAEPAARVFHVRLLRRLGRTERALALLEPAQGARDPELSRLRAELLAESGRSEEALAEYARALVLGADLQACGTGMKALQEGKLVSNEAWRAALETVMRSLADPEPVRAWESGKW